MKKLFIILTIFLSVQTVIHGQVNNQKNLQKANTFLDKKDYENSLKLFKELHATIDRKDNTFSDVAYGFSASLYYTLLEVKKKNDWKIIIELTNEFLKVLEDDKDFIPSELQEKKYWAYKDLIVAYFGLGERDKAKTYQEKLYNAYKNKKLPDGIDQYYNFEKIVYNNQNVWGYEWFAELGDKETKGSFSKHVYYIYSQDKNGEDKELLYTLETVKIHKFKGDEPDFVLTKRIYGNNNEQSQTIWKYTFTNPVSYEKLHNAIMEFLKGGVNPDTNSTIKKK